jgi:beta-phosphoglucomutase-like phosphatase (HAD superfamily)
MPGASTLLNYIITHRVNHVVVTNTSKKNVDFYKTKLPILNNLTIITREDYNRAKPNPDSYQIAKTKFYKGEKYIIGIENTENGYLALHHFTKCIYILTTYNSYNYNKLKNENVYLVDDLSSIFAKEHI